MDKLKGFAEKAFNKNSNSGAAPPAGQPGQGQPAPQGNAGQQDYGDKAFSAGLKKFGISENRERDEKITDGIRNQFEKSTGKHVPDKFSN